MSRRKIISDAIHSLKLGNDYPYDMTGDEDFVPAQDWAHRAARGVIADLTDRRGIKYGFDNIDFDVRIDIVESIAAIIRLAVEQSNNQDRDW